MSEHIRRHLKPDGILTVTIDRPQRKNAFDGAMYLAATEAMAQADDDEAVRVVVLRGEGDTFTSGHDLDDFRQELTSEVEPLERGVFVFLTALHNLDKPVIAAVDGPAFGLGTVVLPYCDLVFATERARFRLPFVDLGLVPAGGTSFLLPRMVGMHRAAELILLAEIFDADTACQLGIVNAVYETTKRLDEAVDETARKLASKPTTSLQYAKRLLRSGERAQLRSAMLEEGRLFAERLGGPAVREALAAFAERRRPDFRKVD